MITKIIAITTPAKPIVNTINPMGTSVVDGSDGVVVSLVGIISTTHWNRSDYLFALNLFLVDTIPSVHKRLELSSEVSPVNTSELVYLEFRQLVTQSKQEVALCRPHGVSNPIEYSCFLGFVLE